jgi:hypothetical protein
MQQFVKCVDPSKKTLKSKSFKQLADIQVNFKMVNEKILSAAKPERTQTRSDKYLMSHFVKIQIV